MFHVKHAEINKCVENNKKTFFAPKKVQNWQNCVDKFQKQLKKKIKYYIFKAVQHL